MGTTKPSSITHSGSVGYTSQGIRLTNTSEGQFGGIYVNDRRFNSINGIIVEFEYMMYGGIGGGGDGMCMFMFNAAEPAPAIGAIGAAIGYTYNSGTVNRKEGLKGGYLGVAFDSFGNHKQARWEVVSNQAGVPYKGTQNSNIEGLPGGIHKDYNVKDEIVLRGAENGPIQAWREATQEWKTRPKGFCGYPVLISNSPYYNKGVIKNDDQIGEYSILPSNYYRGSKFRISGNRPFTSPTDAGYRKAIIELFPAKAVEGGGFYVTVSIQHENGIDVIIKDYHYKQEFYYQENIMMYSQFSQTLDAEQPSFKLNATVPEFLRIGFAATTGEATDNHVIKNLHIRLPRAAEAYDDYVEIHPTQTPSIPIFNNDVAYNGIISKVQYGSKDNIDLRSFRFYDNGIIKSLNASDTYIEHTTIEGTWRYTVATQKVTFKPANGFEGLATIQYDIKGKKDTTPDAGPYDDEAYRSMRATITVDVSQGHQQTGPPQIISNRMIINKIKRGSVWIGG